MLTPKPELLLLLLLLQGTKRLLGHSQLYYRYAAAVKEVQLDFATALAALVVACGILRAPALYRLAHQSNAARRDVFTEVGRTLCEYGCVLPFILLHLLPWRRKQWWPQQHLADATLPYMARRHLIWATAFHTLCDLPFICLLVPTLLSLYRAPWLCRRLYAAGPHPDALRAVAVHGVTELIRDVPAIVASTVVLATG